MICFHSYDNFGKIYTISILSSQCDLYKERNDMYNISNIA